MTDAPAINVRPIHPGEYLREDVLPALGRTKTDIARVLGVSRQTLYDILDEKQAVTAEMALRIGKLCGNGPRIWLALQQAYDLAAAQQAIGPEIATIPTLSEIA